MRSIIAATTILLATAMFISNGSTQPSSSPSKRTTLRTDSQLIVHEWGTFTSFSGSDGVKLEFRPLVDVDLPPFVLDRGRQAGVFIPFSKRNINVVQRMETPVTYFYTDQAIQVNVKVDFPQGLLTEFFPPIERMLPDFNWNESQGIANSSLDWGKVWIIPEDRFQANVANGALGGHLHRRIVQSLLPKTDVDNHYAYARQTDSALVYVERQLDKRRPLAPRGSFFEKFLFYRGVGNFELPLEITAQTNGRFLLSNLGPDPIRSLFLITVDGEQLRFTMYDQILGGQQMALIQSATESSTDELAQAMVNALIDEDLYEKEAVAMVNTWRSSWFGEQGTRLFYMLPRSIIDKLLPLHIEPQPDRVVRVMVGRLEIMRPEDEARIGQLVKLSALNRAAKNAKSESKPIPLPEEIIQLGRLAEPALVRIENIAEEAAIRYEAQILLQQIRQYRDALAAWQWPPRTTLPKP